MIANVALTCRPATSRSYGGRCLLIVFLGLIVLPCQSVALPLRAGRHNRSSFVATRSGLRSCSDQELARYALLAAVGPAAVPSCQPAPEQSLQAPSLRTALERKAADPHSKKNGLITFSARVSSGSTVKSSSSALHFAHLRVIQSDEKWCPHPCDTPTWELASPKPKKGSPYLLLEAAIWRQLRKVTLYKFDDEWDKAARNSYTQLCGGRAWGCANYVNHREAQALVTIPYEEGLDTKSEAFSQFLKDAFTKIFAKVHEEAGVDNTKIGFTYGGHGGDADGSLFAGVMNPPEAVSLLKGLVKSGGKFPIFNFGTNCQESKWLMHAAMHPFADWIIASDLDVGGLKETEMDQEQNMLYMAAQEKLADVAVLKETMEAERPYTEAVNEIIRARQELWSGAMKSAIQAQRLRQSISGFFTSEFPGLSTAIKKAYANLPSDRMDELQEKAMKSGCDVLVVARFLDSAAGAVNLLQRHGKNNMSKAFSLEEHFRFYRPMYASTRKLFDWDTVTHGLGFNARGGMNLGDGKVLPNCDIPGSLGL